MKTYLQELGKESGVWFLAIVGLLIPPLGVFIILMYVVKWLTMPKPQLLTLTREGIEYYYQHKHEDTDEIRQILAVMNGDAGYFNTGKQSFAYDIY